jgi:hypothetical protein
MIKWHLPPIIIVRRSRTHSSSSSNSYPYQDPVDDRYVSAPHFFCFVHGSPEKLMAVHHTTKFSIVSGVSHSFLGVIEG